MKKLVVGFVVAFAAVASQAEYLWWTVDNTSDAVVGYLNGLKSEQKISGSSDVYANIVAKNSSGTVMGQYDYGFTTEWGTGTQGMAVSMESLLGDNYSGANGYSYYIEIRSAPSSVLGDTLVGYNTQAQTYEQMNSAGVFTDDMTPVAQANVWHGGSGSYKATPEPTSAMLMMLGAAMLGLRRKQRKQA